MANKRTTTKRKNYSPKQINYFIKITKDVGKLKVWQKQQKVIKKRIIRELERMDKHLISLKRENAKLKAEKKLNLKRKWVEKQGLKDEILKEMRVSRGNVINKPEMIDTSNRRGVIDYLKPNTISEIRRSYSSLSGDINGVYSELLDRAMDNPKKFKNELIGQIDKLKNLIEVEIQVIGNVSNHNSEVAKLTVRGKTIEEIKSAMDEMGIVPGNSLTSNQFRVFANYIDAGNWGCEHISSTITAIGFKISLIRGK